ncbi:hypothetical protein GCM10026982_15020 [Nocardiopsis aegyptia]
MDDGLGFVVAESFADGLSFMASVQPSLSAVIRWGVTGLSGVEPGGVTLPGGRPRARPMTRARGAAPEGDGG